jgi:CHAD domain-containing protein
MKPRKVKGLDPAAPLADNAERIVRVRLDELCAFMPRAAEDRDALHDMRIAAKRLRYVLEVTHTCFGPYAGSAVKPVKALQEVLGEIHDCDEHLPEVCALREETIAADAAVVGAEPAGLHDAPHRPAWPGLVALEVHLRGRRAALLADFLALWHELERKGFRARLEYALEERSQSLHEPPPEADMMNTAT